MGQTRKFLKENSDIIILSADKGGKTVAMDKEDYHQKMTSILRDICTYRRLKRDPTSSLQTKNNRLVEKLFNLKIIDLTDKNKLTCRAANAPRIYGLPKIHKEGTPLRPICSSLNSPAYGLCKYIVNILKNLTKDSNYNVKDSNDFKTKIKHLQIDDDEVLVSFDVVSLFPSIPVHFAIKTIERKWTIIQDFTNIPKDLFIELVTFCIKDTRYFKYNDNIYEQRKGMPMGSPASPVIADIVMEELLDASLDKMTYKPRILTKYVDDLFAIIKKDEIHNMLQILNSFNRQIQFTMELENDKKLPYLDTIIHRQGYMLKLDWYQKPTASGRLINFNSKHPRRVIINTANNFINRILNISDEEFHQDNIIKITDTLRHNDFPTKTINDLLNKVYYKTVNSKTNIQEDSKIYKTMTYIAGFSERLHHSNLYNKDKYQLALKTHSTVNSLFSKTKSKLKNEDKSDVVYQIMCNGDESNVCQKVYVGTTKTKLKTRLSSHRSDQKAFNRPLEQKTALAAHCTLTGHKPNFDNVKILAQESNYKRRYTLETLHIIDVHSDKRINYKTDTDGCAHIYRHIIQKHKYKQKEFS